MEGKGNSMLFKSQFKFNQGRANLDVIWYSISDRSSFCSKFCCIVAKPIRRGSRSPTRQFLISIPFFCLGLASVGFASNNLSFKAPTSTAYKKFYQAYKSRNPTWWHITVNRIKNLKHQTKQPKHLKQT